MEYTPDNWVILKFNSKVHGTFYKVLAGWSGGYMNGNSWKLNSGITKVDVDGDYYLISGYSGSVYKCHKASEFARMNVQGVLTQLLNTGEVEQVSIDDCIEFLKGIKND